MSVTLDPTVGGASANSYASLSAANDYAAMTVGPSAAAWAAGTDDEAKKKALITATRDIDTLAFIGARASETQALEWPRTGARTESGRLYDSALLPTNLVAATIELAINYLANADSDVGNPEVDNRKSVKAGDVAVEFFAPSSDDDDPLELFPDAVQRLLAALVVTALMGQWGTGVVTRTS